LSLRAFLLAGLLVMAAGGHAELRVTPLANGAQIAAETRDASPVDALAVAFGWWSGDVLIGGGEREVLAAAMQAMVTDRALEAGCHGCDFACWASPDAIELQAIGPAGRAGDMADVLASALAGPVTNRAARAAAVRFGRAETAPYSSRQLVADELLRRLFPGVPIAEPPSIIARASEALDGAALERLRRSRLVGARCGASVIGGLSAEPAAAALGLSLAELPRGEERAHAGATMPPAPGPWIVPYPGSATWIGIGFRVPGMGAEEPPTFAVLEKLLGDGNGSLLFGRLRGELDLAYTVGAELAIYAGAGYLAVWCACRPGDAERALGEMSAIVEGLTAGVPEPSLRRAVERARFERAMERHAASVAARRSARRLALGLEATGDSGFEEGLARVTARDVADVARTWLRAPVVVIGNPGGTVGRQSNTEGH